MINKKNEAVLLGYKLLFDSKGNLVTERTSTDLAAMKESFSEKDYHLLTSVLFETKTRLDKIHIEIEKALDSRK